MMMNHSREIILTHPLGARMHSNELSTVLHFAQNAQNNQLDVQVDLLDVWNHQPEYRSSNK